MHDLKWVCVYETGIVLCNSTVHPSPACGALTVCYDITLIHCICSVYRWHPQNFRNAFYVNERCLLHTFPPFPIHHQFVFCNQSDSALILHLGYWDFTVNRHVICCIGTEETGQGQASSLSPLVVHKILNYKSHSYKLINACVNTSSFIALSRNNITGMLFLSVSGVLRKLAFCIWWLQTV